MRLEEYRSLRQASWQKRLQEFITWYLSFQSYTATCLETRKNVQKNIFPITWLSPYFPQCLLHLDDPPPVLYANHPWDKWRWPVRRIAIIGSRNMSAYGRQATQEIVRDLVHLYDACVVSGGARGVDICAQQQAMSCEGKTIGVLGCGLNKMTAWQQKELRSHANALWVSEFPPTFSAQSWTFVQRNRLIAGFGEGLLVVEAQEKSGTMITVSHALNQGKEVCVIPQNLWNKNSSGIIQLANQGATLVQSAAEIASLLWGEKKQHQDDSSLDTPLENEIMQKLRENNGEMVLADLLYCCPDTIEQPQWESAVRTLERKQHIRFDLGTVHCQSMIKS